jgi:hypothetical protein
MAALVTVMLPSAARAQGFISPTYGYNFGGDAGCRTAPTAATRTGTGASRSASLGSVVGFEAELTYEGSSPATSNRRDRVTTLMGNFLLAPRISFVQPYGLVGVGAIRTRARDDVATDREFRHVDSGWTIGGGLIVFVQKHIGLKADVRYYHSFEVVDLLNFELDRDSQQDRLRPRRIRGRLPVLMDLSLSAVLGAVVWLARGRVRVRDLVQRVQEQLELPRQRSGKAPSPPAHRMFPPLPRALLCVRFMCLCVRVPHSLARGKLSRCAPHRPLMSARALFCFTA